MKLAILESPYAGDIEANIKYARACMRDMLVNHNEAPFASHLLYTQDGVLDDGIAAERAFGIEAGFKWKQAQGAVTVFYTDMGMSSGMEQALKYCRDHGLPYEFRSLSDD